MLETKSQNDESAQRMHAYESARSKVGPYIVVADDIEINLEAIKANLMEID